MDTAYVRENHGKSTPQNSLTGFSTSILMIRLVVQKSGKHQLIRYISQYLQGFSLAPSQVVGKGISETSTVESTVHPGRSTWFTYKSPILERNMIFQASMRTCSALIFQGVDSLVFHPKGGCYLRGNSTWITLRSGTRSCQTW